MKLISDIIALPGWNTSMLMLLAKVNEQKGEQVSKALVRAMLKSGEKSEAALTQLLNSTDARVRESAVRGLAGRESFNPRPRPFP